MLRVKALYLTKILIFCQKGLGTKRHILVHVSSTSQLLWLEIALFSKKALHNIEKHS